MSHTIRPHRLARGRHAPPIEVRQDLQRYRLFQSARMLLELGQPLTAENIAREAGMSKATFYALWRNVSDFMPALLRDIQANPDEADFETDQLASVQRAAAKSGIALGMRTTILLNDALVAEGWSFAGRSD